MVSCLLLAALFFPATAQETPSEAGPHHRTVTTVEQILLPDGSVAFENHTVVQLELGLNRLEHGAWVEARESLEIIGNTVVARQTAHRVIWAANANSRGAVDVELPDGTRLVSHCLGLSYYDAASGQSVLIAELKDSIAEVHPPDMVLYADVFDDVDGDLLYLNRKGRFEQLVVLHAKPTPPEDFGLDPATTRLEVMTEFLNPPEPRKSPRVVRLETDDRVRATMVEPDLVDEELDFGPMFMGAGQAFLPAGEPWRMEAATAVPVSKRWVRTPEGRTVLFEAVEHQSLAPLLATLPAPAGGPRVARHRLPSTTRVLPTRRLAAQERAPIHMTSVNRVRSGLVLDYPLSTAFTNYVFRGDTTYYVTGAINCVGTNTVFEAGAVIKFAPTNNAHLDLASANITWLGTAFRPVILTASDDSSVGAVATTNALSGYYGTTALNFLNPLTNVTVAHVRVAHAKGAMAFSQGNGHTVSHAQIVNCGKGMVLSGSEVRLRNALMANVSTNLDLTSSTIRVEHLTVNTAARLNTAGVLYLTNSLLVAVTATNGWTGVSNVFVASASGVFATVGAGSHYLASGSPYRDAGTTAIDPTLRKGLKGMTTVAPVWLTNAITAATTLSPQAARDSDTPDLGYHYAPLDYLLSNVVLQATLTLTNGVALGMCGTYGLSMQSGSQVWSEGTPLAYNRLAGPALVLEQSVNLGQAQGMNQPGAYNPTIRLRFTEVSLKGGAKAAVFNPSSYAFAEFSMRDSWLRGATLSCNPNTYSTVLSALTNNVIERSDLQFYHSDGSQNSYHIVQLFNNLFINTGLTVLYYAGTYNPTWKIQDNLFEGGSTYGYGSGYSSNVTVSHDGFISGTYNGLGGSNHKTGLTADYQAGTLGSYYYPTNGSGLNQLRDAGSRTNAGLAALYHYTTTTNQVKDASTVLDIGYHYVATDGNGIPLDGDGDSWPDVLEDRDGDNVLDAGETDWQDASDLGLRVRITVPQPGTTLP